MIKRLTVGVLVAAIAILAALSADGARLYPLKFQYFKDDGTSAAGYKVYTYESGTTTPKTTYTDPAQSANNTNPVILDARGEADIFFGDGLYRLKICDENGANCKTRDNWGAGWTLSSGESDNLARNGSFETDTDGDGTPDNWGVTAYTGGAVSLITDDQYHGAKSAKFVSAGSGGGYYTSENFFETTPGRTLYVSFALKSSVADVRNLAQVTWYDSAQASISTVSVYDESAANPTSWATKIFSATPPSTARYAKIALYGCHSSDSTPGTTWYDDVRAVAPMEDKSGGLGAFSNLKIQTNATTPASQLDVTADFVTLSDDSGNAYQARNVSVTGANCAMPTHLDTGSEAANTWYAVYIVSTGSAEGCLYSTSFSSPTMGSWKYRRFVGATFNNATSDFNPFKQYDRIFVWNSRQSVASGLTATTFTAQSVATRAPTASGRVGQLWVGGKADSGTNNITMLSTDGTNMAVVLDLYYTLSGVGDMNELAGIVRTHTPLYPNGDNIYYKVNGAAPVTLYLKAFELRL